MRNGSGVMDGSGGDGSEWGVKDGSGVCGMGMGMGGDGWEWGVGWEWEWGVKNGIGG